MESEFIRVRKHVSVYTVLGSLSRDTHDVYGSVLMYLIDPEGIPKNPLERVIFLGNVQTLKFRSMAEVFGKGWVPE